MVQAFLISTRSMNLTLLPGDRFLVDKMWYRFMPIKRGDVVAFHGKGPQSEIYGHRVIGLPGDVVEIRNEKLFLNEELQNETYVHFESEDASRPPIPKLKNFGPITIPEGCFFEMGDNRRVSMDSRIRGCIPLRDIVGKVQVIYWSSGPKSPDAEINFSQISSNGPKHSENVIRWNRTGMRVE
jgi:signal peptidase I